jgi:Na+/H+ antiporter NhaD/arsenite permease-like protein
MKSVSTFLLVAHIIAGSLAVVVGLVALVTRKPVRAAATAAAGGAHKKSGKLFLYAMCVVIATAAVLTLISLNPYFAGLTAASAVAVFSGYRVLSRKRPDLNANHRARAVDWIVTLIILAIGVLLIALGATGGITKNLPVVYSLGVGSALYAGYDLYRFARPLAPPFSPNLWLYEHLVKMIGGYFGAVAAFSGSVLVLLPEPWRQLWATSLGQTLAVVLVIYYRRRLNTRKPQDARRIAEAPAPLSIGR